MKKHLVLVGGGHAHMVTLANIGRFVEKGYRVTVIGPSEYHYYSGMGPGMLGGTYSPDQIPGPASGSIMMWSPLMPGPTFLCRGGILPEKTGRTICIRSNPSSS